MVALDNAAMEKDCGMVAITGKLKPSKQCAAAAARSNRLLGFNHPNFSRFNTVTELNLCK